MGLQFLNQDDADDLQEQVKKKDNRNYVDTSEAQEITEQQIAKLREQGKSELEVIATLVKGSKTFKDRNKFSKQKYILNKLKKHLFLVELRKPTIPILVQHFWKFKPQQICNLRPDSFSMLINYSNIWSGANVGVIQNTNGLVTIGLVDRVGKNGKIQHFSFNHGAKLEYMSYYSQGFRYLVQFWDILEMKKSQEHFGQLLLNKLTEKLDSIVIVHDKYRPLDLLSSIWKYLKNSGNFVIFSPFLEPLVEVKKELVDLKAAILVEVQQLWMRKYQVETLRTHPQMRMHPSSGYIIHGVKVKSKFPQ